MGDKKLTSGERSSRIAGLAGEVQKEGALNRDKEKNPLLEKIAGSLDKMAENFSATKVGDAVGASLRGGGAIDVNVLSGKP